MKNKLEESHQTSTATLSKEKRAISSERNAINDRQMLLKDQAVHDKNVGEGLNTGDDGALETHENEISMTDYDSMQSFDITTDFFSNIAEKSVTSVGDYYKRIVTIREEQHWLESEPSSENWNLLRNRVLLDEAVKEKLESSSSLIKAYNESKLGNSDAINKIYEAQLHEEICKGIYNDILTLVVEMFAVNIAHYLLEISSIAASEIESTICSAVFGLNEKR
jgi:hypothetical protein